MLFHIPHTDDIGFSHATEEATFTVTRNVIKRADVKSSSLQYT